MDPYSREAYSVKLTVLALECRGARLRRDGWAYRRVAPGTSLREKGHVMDRESFTSSREKGNQLHRGRKNSKANDII